MIKLIFYKANAHNRTLLDQIIDVGTGCIGFSHVEIFDERYNKYFSISGRENISRHTTIDENNGNWTIVELSNANISNYDIIDMLKNKKYDYWNILVFLFPFLYIDIRDKIICSSAIVEILKFNNIMELALYHSFRISPNKLFKILDRREDVKVTNY